MNTLASTRVPGGNVNSAFYIGRVLHERYLPKRHSFNYPLYMCALDLDEVDSLDARHWWFSTRHWAPLQLRLDDYFRGVVEARVARPDVSLAAQLKHRVLEKAQQLGADPTCVERVVKLAQLRCFGIYFSPVNFFFLYQGDSCRYMLAEVSNTPWNECHHYLVDVNNPLHSKKEFHVSPFMDMDMEYRWRVRTPARRTFIGIENWTEKCLFKAMFAARRFEISPLNVTRVLLQWPVVSLSILKNIYWQALRLFLKGVRYVPYPASKDSKSGAVENLPVVAKNVNREVTHEGVSN